METTKLLRTAKLLFAFLLLGSAFAPFVASGDDDGDPPPPIRTPARGGPAMKPTVAKKVTRLRRRIDAN